MRVGANGSITVRNASPGATHVVLDVYGLFVGGSVTIHGGFVPLSSPQRVLDSRIVLGYGGAVGPNGSFTMTPGMPTAAALALNATVTSTTAPGFLSVWPADRARPTASQVNFYAKQTVANFGQIKLSATKTLAFANISPGTTQVICDVSGYYLA